MSQLLVHYTLVSLESIDLFASLPDISFTGAEPMSSIINEVDDDEDEYQYCI
jgi:hypothetical protein